ncbi:synaptonemal complex central element protein 3 [Pelobates fuscus]|uniref:synaptonemal complex central element protein 3 n=1 Tax=Pelobates fuscus TaxID=191477 RepID=UPI002FE43393
MESDAAIVSYSDASNMLKNMNKDLEKMQEEMEKISAQAMWMTYDMVVIRTKPDLADSQKRLEETFLKCKEDIEKKWLEMLDKPKGDA